MIPTSPPSSPAAVELAGAALHTLMDSGLQLGLAVLDADFRFLRINEPLAAANGPPVEAHIGRTVREVLPTAADVVEPLLRQVMAGQALRDIRILAVVPSVGEGLSEWSATYLPIPGPDGRPIGILAHAVNLTLQRRHEALEEETAQLRRILDCSFVYIGMLTPEGIVLEANRAALDDADIGIDDVRERHVWDTYWFTHDPALQDWLREIVPAVARGERVVRRDITVRMAADRLMTIDYMLAPLRDATGRVIRLVASAIDISERLSAQRRLEQALGEKTVLLDELHHRVKNNLQVISSLLQLQARNAEPGVQAALLDCRSRVRSMSLMHELLYEHADVSVVDLGSYLRRMSGLLRDSYLGGGTAVHVSVELPPGGLPMALQRAIPCGLLLTELQTNALKHAFPSGRGGEVRVRVAMQPSGALQFDIADDGIGLPPHAPPALGMGLQLLPMLAQQCGGTLERVLEVDTGTHFRLQLPPGSLAWLEEGGHA